MKMKFYTLFALLLSFACIAQAQDVAGADEAQTQTEELSKKALKKDAQNAATGEEYRRTSLCLVMAEDTQVENSDVIKEGFLNSVMPDKYNDHNVGERIFQLESISLTDGDRALFQEAVERGKRSESDAKSAANSIQEVGEEPAADDAGDDGKKKKGKSGGGGFGKFAGGMLNAVTATTSSDSEESSEDVSSLFSSADEAAMAYKYLCDNNVAYEMAHKWFFNEAGTNTMDLIIERGLYDASASAIDISAASFRGEAGLGDTGEDLIGKSFVIVSKYNYLSKDELVAQLDAVAQLIASQINNQYAAMAAKAATMAVKASLGAGYYVQTKSHLFQFDWNEDVQNIALNTGWDNPEVWEENADKFKLNYIGSENAWANVKAGIFTDKSPAELIYGATVNAMDNVLAKMNKKYEVFKSKTPLKVTADMDGKMILSAKIGLKEGLSGGDKFEVLEKSIDSKTLKVTYKRVGVIKVNKNQIWDNRYGADEEREITDTAQSFDETLFDGGKTKFYSGLLIKQLK